MQWLPFGGDHCDIYDVLHHSWKSNEVPESWETSCTLRRESWTKRKHKLKGSSQTRKVCGQKLKVLILLQHDLIKHLLLLVHSNSTQIFSQSSFSLCTGLSIFHRNSIHMVSDLFIHIKTHQNNSRKAPDVQKALWTVSLLGMKTLLCS